MAAFWSILDTVGNTPLVRIDKFAKEKGVEANLLAKLEFFNPLAGVKDRIGLALIEALERDGRAVRSRNRSSSSRLPAMPVSRWLLLLRPGLSPRSHHAGNHVGGTPQALKTTRCRTGSDRRRKRHEGRLSRKQAVRATRTQSSRSSSKIRPTRKSIASRRLKIWNDTNGEADI